MTLHISEIGIRLSIGEPPTKATPAPSTSAPAAPGLSPQDIEALVQRCTQQVLQTLRLLEER